MFTGPGGYYGGNCNAWGGLGPPPEAKEFDPSFVLFGPATSLGVEVVRIEKVTRSPSNQCAAALVVPTVRVTEAIGNPALVMELNQPSLDLLGREVVVGLRFRRRGRGSHAGIRIDDPFGARKIDGAPDGTGGVLT
jgi:hypothetical protein